MSDDVDRSTNGSALRSPDEPLREIVEQSIVSLAPEAKSLAGLVVSVSSEAASNNTATQLDAVC
jgi:hypothetical protein